MKNRQQLLMINLNTYTIHEVAQIKSYIHNYIYDVWEEKGIVCICLLRHDVIDEKKEYRNDNFNTVLVKYEIPLNK